MEIKIRFKCLDLKLPMNHQYNVQSMIYRGLSEDPAYSTFLHDSGYMYGERQFRLFTFSRLSGHYRIESGCLVYPEEFILRLRSIDQRMIRLLCNSFFPGTEHKLCGQKTAVVECTASDYHIFETGCDFITCSPLVAYRTVGNGRTHYYSPYDSEFYELLSDNAERKWISYYDEPIPDYLEISPKGDRFKKIVTEYKGIYVTGWMGPFHVEAPAALLDFLYQTGVGAKSSQGFGMVDLNYS